MNKPSIVNPEQQQDSKQVPLWCSGSLITPWTWLDSPQQDLEFDSQEILLSKFQNEQFIL